MSLGAPSKSGFLFDEGAEWIKDLYFISLRTSEIHLFYNLLFFYWHFLEILWMFIFLVLYFSNFEVSRIWKPTERIWCWWENYLDTHKIETSLGWAYSCLSKIYILFP